MTTNHYRTRRGVSRRKPLVNCKRQLLVPVSVVDVCPMWQDEGFPEVGILPSALFYYSPDGRWLLGRQTGRGAYVEWETLRPLDARHWLLDNGVELEDLSENMRAALKWTSNHSEKRRTRSARIAGEDKAVLESWQRWRRISQVDILTQAGGGAVRGAGDSGGGERGEAGIQRVPRGQDTQPRFKGVAEDRQAAEAFAAPGLSLGVAPVRSKAGGAWLKKTTGRVSRRCRR